MPAFQAFPHISLALAEIFAAHRLNLSKIRTSGAEISIALLKTIVCATLLHNGNESHTLSEIFSTIPFAHATNSFAMQIAFSA